jgi:phosphatidylserine decarboxylase
MSNFSRGFGSMVSRVVGVLARLESPKSVITFLQTLFIKKYKLNMSECVIPDAGRFSSLHTLFIRDLKPGARFIDVEPISPADGTLRDIQDSAGELVQVKGINYTVSELTAGRATTGVVVNMYLSPKDYHQVHSPVTGFLKEIAFVPGALWPVNDWALRNVCKLFSTNERAIFTIDTQSLGTIYLVMVGALNVGNILTPWGESPSEVTGNESVLSPQCSIVAGDKLGAFALGSSVLVVLPSSHFGQQEAKVGGIKLGESLQLRGLVKRGTST